MRAIILAAGMGVRLGKYTKELPKAMLSFNGKPLIEWQIDQLRRSGYDDISVVTGYRSDAFKMEGVTYYHNPDFSTTNMVESLMCAKEKLNDEVLICYGDILYTQEILQDIQNFDGEIGISADKDWRAYWMMRYGKVDFDIESFFVEGDKITDIGRELDSDEGLELRYVGLIKLSKAGAQKSIDLYEERKSKGENWSQSGNTFQQGYMTDLINELIVKGELVQPIVSSRGWIEFDTVGDYETYLDLLSKNQLEGAFFD